jgi:hypothetical protein
MYIPFLYEVLKAVRISILVFWDITITGSSGDRLSRRPRLTQGCSTKRKEGRDITMSGRYMLPPPSRLKWKMEISCSCETLVTTCFGNLNITISICVFGISLYFLFK